MGLINNEDEINNSREVRTQNCLSANEQKTKKNVVYFGEHRIKFCAAVEKVTSTKVLGVHK